MAAKLNKRSQVLLASAALLALAGNACAVMSEMADAEIQQVTGQDGLSIVLSNNYGYKMMDIPGKNAGDPVTPNSIRFISPRRPMFDATQMTEFDKEYFEIADLAVSTSNYAPMTDPILFDLVTLADGKAAIQLSMPQNSSGLGKKSIGLTLNNYARVLDYNKPTTTGVIPPAPDMLAPEKWTIGRLEINDMVQKSSKFMLTPMNDGFGISAETELNIANITLHPQFTRNADQSYTLPDEEWIRASNVALCGTLTTSDTCTPGSKFTLGDPVRGPMVLKAENINGSPAITLTMGNVNVQAKDGDTPLAQGSIVIDSLQAKTGTASIPSRCAGGMCDFGKQIIGDIKIYSMRVRLTDLNR